MILQNNKKLKLILKISLPIGILFLLTACSDEEIDSNSIIQCDSIIEKNYYEICYDYNLKGALFVSYSLNGSLVDNPNITQRPPFYKESTIPKEYQSDYYDYTGSGYDRGHLANDASFDYSDSSLTSVYTMANIIPQDSDVNRYSWIDTENLEREKAKLYQDVDVVIGIKYSDNPLTIGENEIAVPFGFYKKISNLEHNYEECFYYENIPYDIESDTILEHKTSCSSLNFDYY
ncbi:MAG: DNA/RNA non-specific endonuclease [Campylobacterota bacterium]|nr:DNA/RNA non-specific endonuclease [Campylobacterota bacterium]